MTVNSIQYQMMFQSEKYLRKAMLGKTWVMYKTWIKDYIHKSRVLLQYNEFANVV